MKKHFYLKILLLLFSFFYSSSILAQNRRGNIWYFGNKAGIDFNTTPPTALTNGQSYTWEGSSSIADENGNLLFYVGTVDNAANTANVWNRNHTIMPNGFNLLAGSSSSTGSVIAPVIGDPNKYYIFTTGNADGAGAIGLKLCYSVVDMCLDGGKGDVVAASKNTLMLSISLEKSALTKHANGIDYWVVTAEAGTHKYYAFLVTAAGVNLTPVVSTVITPGQAMNDASSGQMRFSYDGKLLVNCLSMASAGKVVASKFNAQTGQLTDGIIISNSAHSYYGVTFSPNDSLIYVSTVDGSGPFRLQRYERFALNIPVTETLLEEIPTTPGIMGHLQTAPDGKIYGVYGKTNADSLLVINIPNSITTPSVQTNGFYLGGKQITLGLPYFFDAFAIASTNALPGVAGADKSICKGDSALLGITSVNGYSYSWFPAAGLGNTTISNPKAAPSITTSYTLTITDNCGNLHRDGVQVTVYSLAAANASPDMTYCLGGDSVQLNVTGGSSFIWSPAAGLSCSNCPDPKAAPGITTTYTVIADFNTSCQNKSSVVITVSPDFTLTPNPTSAGICRGETVQLGITENPVFAPYSYSWYPYTQWSLATGVSDPGIANPTTSPVITTTYIVTAISNTGCKRKDTIVVTVGNIYLPQAIATNTLICPGSSTQLNTNTFAGLCEIATVPCSGASQLITVGAGTAQSDIYSPVYYTATIDANRKQYLFLKSELDAMGFSGGGIITSIAVNHAGTGGRNRAAVIKIGCTSLTEFSSANFVPALLQVKQFDYNPVAGWNTFALDNPYVWDGQSNLIVEFCGPTTSATTASSILGDNTTFNSLIYLNGGTDICTDPQIGSIAAWRPNMQFTFCPILPPSLVYSWTPTTSLNNAAISSPIATPSVTTTYMINVADGPCVRTNTITIYVDIPAATILPGGPIDLCESDSIVLTSGLASSYLWSTGETTQSITVHPTTTTQYSVAVTNGICIADTSTMVTIIQGPVPNAGIDSTICRGNTITLSASGGIGYTWNPDPTLSSTSIQNPIVTPTITTTYTVAVSNGLCSASDAVTITVLPVPVAAISPAGPLALCETDSIVLTSGLASGYIWSTGATTVSITVHPSADTQYIISVSNGICTATVSAIITIDQSPVPNAGMDSTICMGNTITLSASGGTGYIWTPGPTLSNTTIQNPIATPSATTTYTVTVSNGSCSENDAVTIIVLPPPSAEAGNDVTILEGEYTILSAMGGGTYSWSPSTGLSCITCQNPTANPEITTKYYLAITDQNGCTSMDSILVTVDVLCTELFLPTAFSPNDDGQNDILYVIGNCIQKMTFVIYNRWGETVFETDNSSQGWDGYSEGIRMGTDLFFYSFEAELTNGKIIIQKGNISLIR